MTELTLERNKNHFPLYLLINASYILHLFKIHERKESEYHTNLIRSLAGTFRDNCFML